MVPKSTQSCSYCKKPRPMLFKLIENKPNFGAVERLACFPCLEDIARKEMAKHRDEQMPAAKGADAKSL